MRNTRIFMLLTVFAPMLGGCAWDLLDPNQSLDWVEGLGPKKAPSALHEDLVNTLAETGAPGAAAELQAPETQRERAGSNDFGDQPLPWDGKLRAASTTKTFTAVVVLQLVEEGRLSLDDTVEKWLPGVVQGNGNDGSEITIKQLLRHETGLGDYLTTPEVAALVRSSRAFDAHRHDTLEQAQYVGYALQQEPSFEPGTRFGYANTNYVLLGMIIEAITHEPWGDQVVQRISEPLGLSNTTVPGSNPISGEPYVRGWMVFPDEVDYVDVSDNGFLIGADAGVVTTLSDLNAFFRGLIGGQLLSPAMLATMQETVSIQHPAFPNGRYGLGLQWSPLSCGDGYWHHTGDTFGYTIRTGVLADGSRSVAAVINGALETPEAADAAAQLVDRALCGHRS